MDTPLCRVPVKPHILMQHDATPPPDPGTSGQVKPELGHIDLAGHTAVGQVKSELGHPSTPGQHKVTSSEEDARKLRQAQQKLRQEQWKKRNVGVAQGGEAGDEGVAGDVGVACGSIPDSDLMKEMRKCEKELISNGKLSYVRIVISWYLFLDDPVFWDRIMLSQECSSSPSAYSLPPPRGPGGSRDAAEQGTRQAQGASEGGVGVGPNPAKRAKPSQ